MKVKLLRKDGEETWPMAIFENWGEAEQAALLLAQANVFDYQLISGSNRTDIRSYCRVLCPGCHADYTYSELQGRRSFGDKLCDCGQRFYLDGLQFKGETAEAYIY